jgi:HSP20 family molecular chaperone IbpA
MKKYNITIKLNKNQEFEIIIGDNPNITFDYLIEYLAYNYPSVNFCPCFVITDNKKQVIKNNKKVIEYINTTKNQKFYTTSPSECYCNKNDLLLKKTFNKTKREIIEDLSQKLNILPEFGESYNEKILLKNDSENIEKNKKISINHQNIESLQENNVLIDKNTNQIIGNEKNIFKKNFIDFYDVIVDIKSIKNISNGWEIKMSDKGKKNYEEKQQQTCIKIGIIGNSNKGKSFILSKISKTYLPSGSNIRTEGLSIKYPDLKENENKKIILLDSAGLETPVLREKKVSNDHKDDDSFNIIKDNKNEKGNNNEDNKNVKNDSNTKDEFKEKSREKLITELFLQDYIIKKSDVLLVVVGNLTYSEQKLLNKIKLLQKKISKPLFIIHNLITFTLIEQVEEYIEEFLFNSFTFTVEQGLNVTTNKESIKGKYFYEKKNGPPIFHLIYANEGSEAGNYFNNPTLQFIEHSYQSITNPEPFDVIDSIKKEFIDLSQEIFEKMEKNITMDDFEKGTKLIKLNNHNNLTLKKCFIDELGFSNLKSNEFEPKYNCYQKDDKYTVKIECPGNFGISNYSLKENVGYKFLTIMGEKRNDKDPKNVSDNVYTSREYGKFSIDVPIKFEDKYALKNSKPKIDNKRGIIFFEFQLEEIMKGEAYEPKDEDDI